MQRTVLGARVSTNREIACSTRLVCTTFRTSLGSQTSHDPALFVMRLAPDMAALQTDHVVLQRAVAARPEKNYMGKGFSETLFYSRWIS